MLGILLELLLARLVGWPALEEPVVKDCAICDEVC